MSETKQVALNIDIPLLDEVDRLAREARRNRTQQVLYMIEQSMRGSVPEEASVTSPSV